MNWETIIARFLLVVLAACRVVLEFFGELFYRKLGYWVLRLITLGRYEPDEEGWVCTILGLAVLVLSIWAVTEWIW